MAFVELPRHPLPEINWFSSSPFCCYLPAFFWLALVNRIIEPRVEQTACSTVLEQCATWAFGSQLLIIYTLTSFGALGIVNMKIKPFSTLYLTENKRNDNRTTLSSAKGCSVQLKGNAAAFSSNASCDLASLELSAHLFLSHFPFLVSQIFPISV